MPFIINKETFDFYCFPHTSEPSKYLIYIFIKNYGSENSVSEQLKKEIKDIINNPSLIELHIISRNGTSVPTIEYDAWNETLENIFKINGLSWIEKPINQIKIFTRSIKKNESIELPFIYEFAHDLERSKRMVDSDFDKISPISAEFIPTLNCPFRCQQCSYKMQKISCGVWPLNDASDPRWHMKIDIVKPLIQRLAESGIKYMVITGGGEPLMNPEVTLTAIKEAINLGIITGLYTNGACLTKNIANRILELSPKFVRVSINAGSEKVHTEYHMPIGKKPLFNNVIEGVRYLALHKVMTNNKTEIGLSYIINRINYRDCENFANLVAEIVHTVNKLSDNSSPSIDFVRFTPTLKYFSDRQEEQEFFNDAYILIEKTIPILEQVNVTPILFSNRFLHMNEQKDYEECLGCSWFAEVSPDGSLYICCEMDFFPAYLIGDLLRHSIQTIWKDSMRHNVLSRLSKSKLRGCPVFCKPHIINKVSNKIKKLITEHKNKEIVLLWLKDLYDLNNWEGDENFKKSKIVAF